MRAFDVAFQRFQLETDLALAVAALDSAIGLAESHGASQDKLLKLREIYNSLLETITVIV